MPSCRPGGGWLKIGISDQASLLHPSANERDMRLITVVLNVENALKEEEAPLKSSFPNC